MKLSGITVPSTILTRNRAKLLLLKLARLFCDINTGRQSAWTHRDSEINTQEEWKEAGGKLVRLKDSGVCLHTTMGDQQTRKPVAGGDGGPRSFALVLDILRNGRQLLSVR
jgi:hypothetical protein